MTLPSALGAGEEESGPATTTRIRSKAEPHHNIQVREPKWGICRGEPFCPCAGGRKGSFVPETFLTSQIDRPLWTAPQLAAKLAIHHLTLLKKVQDVRGKFEIPCGAFKLGNSWRWRDEDVQAFFLEKAGVALRTPIQPPIPSPSAHPRGRGRPRSTARQGGAAC